MVCTNPECEMFQKETLRGIVAKDGGESSYCIYCHSTIDESLQPVAEMSKGPYVKRKNWLNEWKLVNVGKTADDVKLKPNFNT